MKWLDDNYKPTGAFILGIAFFSFMLVFIGTSPFVMTMSLVPLLIGTIGMTISGLWSLVYSFGNDNIDESSKMENSKIGSVD